MKSYPVLILCCLLLLTACDMEETQRYFEESCSYFFVYQYKSEEYFDYVAFHDDAKEQPIVVPAFDSNEPLWLTHDCGRRGKDVPILHGYNPAAVDSLSLCEFLPKAIFRFDNNFFIYTNFILEPYPTFYRGFKVYNIRRADYCSGFDSDTVRYTDEHPFKGLYKIPYKVFTGFVGGKVPNFREFVECISACINDSSICNYKDNNFYYEKYNQVY